MIADQNNACKACAKQFGTSRNSRPCIDHEHTTGKIRDILCGGCNTALGHIKENFDAALGLARYIQDHTGVI